jgi:hypothetical protein
MPRELMGPVTKTLDETFFLEVTLIEDTIPEGEALDPNSVVLKAIRKDSDPEEDTTDDLFGVTPETSVSGNLVKARLIVSAQADLGEHLVEVEIQTDAGTTTFHAGALVVVVTERDPVLYVSKKDGEVFPVGIRFARVLDTGETITSAEATSTEKFDGANADALLFSGGVQITDDVVAQELKALTDGTQIGDYRIRIEARTSNSNRFEEVIEVEVEASISS